jgi:hypothetical protein
MNERMTCPVCGRMGLPVVRAGLRRHWTEDYWSVPCPYRRTEAEIVAMDTTVDALLEHAARHRIGTWDSAELKVRWLASLKEVRPE